MTTTVQRQLKNQTIQQQPQQKQCASFLDQWFFGKLLLFSCALALIVSRLRYVCSFKALLFW